MNGKFFLSLRSRVPVFAVYFLNCIEIIETFKRQTGTDSLSALDEKNVD